MDVSVKLLSPKLDLCGYEGSADRWVKITYGGVPNPFDSNQLCRQPSLHLGGDAQRSSIPDALRFAAVPTTSCALRKSLTIIALLAAEAPSLSIKPLPG